MCLISIILPVYNDHCYINEAIEGILSQSFSDFELIVVDDGSNPPIHEVVSQELMSDSRLSIVIQKNSGLPKALSLGFLLASGEYCTWTSADNITSKHYLFHFSNYLKNNPHLSFVYSDIFLIDDDGKPYMYSDFMELFRSPTYSPHISLPHFSKSMLDLGYNHILASFMFKREIVHTLLLHRNVFGVEDFDFWLRSEKFGLHKFDIDYMMYYYRVHKKSLTSRAKELNLSNRLRELLDHEHNRRKLLDLFLEKKVVNEWANLKGNYIWHCDSLECYENQKIDGVFSEESISIIGADSNIYDTFCALETTPILNLLDISRDKDDSLALYSIPVDFISDKAELIASNFIVNSKLFRAEQNFNFVKTSLPSESIIYKSNKNLSKVLVIIPSAHEGGLERVALSIANAMQECDREITIATNNNDLIHKIEKKFVNLKVVFLNEFNQKSVSDFAIEHGFNIIFSHHSFDLLGLPSLLKKTASSIVVVHIFHNSSLWLSKEQREEVSGRITDQDFFVFVSNQAALFSQFYLGIPLRQSLVIENFGYESLTRSTDRVAKKIQKSKFLNFAVVGSITPAKNQLFAVEGFKKVLDELSTNLDVIPQLFLYGSEVDSVYASAVIESIGDNINIHFKGRQDDFWENVDILLLPSLWEGSALTIYEAFIRGKQLILSDVGDALRYKSLYRGHITLLRGYSSHILNGDSIEDFVHRAYHFDDKEMIDFVEKLKVIINNKNSSFSMNNQFNDSFVTDLHLKWCSMWGDLVSSIELDSNKWSFVKRKLTVSRMLIQEYFIINGRF